VHLLREERSSVAKHPSEPAASEPAPKAHGGRGRAAYLVSFAGQPAITVEAASSEAAIEAAAKALGVTAWESAPAVVEVVS